MNITWENPDQPARHTILIVDDNPANLEVVGDYLAKYGLQVMGTRDGETALKLARQDQPDLILLDVLLPGIDGFEVCRRLKVDEQTREIPVIFMTIVTKTEDKVTGFEAGGVDYITKPFQQEEVLARVTTHLRMRDLTRRLEEAKESLERRVEKRTAALKRERTLIANIMETSPVSITVVNRQGQVTFANSQAEQVLGLTKDEITQRTYNAPAWRITDFAGGPFPDEKLLFRQVMATRQPVYDVQHAIEWPDGRRVLLSINGAPFLNESGQVESVVFALQDITERKQAEAALRDSEERLRLTMEATNIGSWDWDVENDIWSASPIYYTMLGYEPKAGQGDRSEWLERVHPDDRAYVAGKIQDVLTRDFKEHRYEARLRHADGTYRWQYVRGFGIERDEKGKVTRMLGIRMDITERKQAEDKLRRFNEELEQRVLDRTAQLEAVNKELEAFAYSISHDLRAPLRHIDGYLELLKQRMTETLDERSRHYMATISNAATRMGQLIDDLLAFSRMGRNELSKTPVDLDTLVQDIIRELAPETQDRAIRWRIAPLPTVTGDRAMLHLVLTNLLANALKFTRGCAPADIEIGYQAGEKETIIFIRDNGVGFDMAYADKLFGVFQRLHRVEEFEGTGIGLANTRRIISRHGGRVWAEGKVDQGATFYFSLPQSIQKN